jgi:hypothetical protein
LWATNVSKIQLSNSPIKLVVSKEIQNVNTVNSNK